MAFSIVTTVNLSYSESFSIKELSLGFQSNLLISVSNIPNLSLLPDNWMFAGAAYKIKFANSEVAIVASEKLFLRYATLLEWEESEEYFVGIKINRWLWRYASLPGMSQQISVDIATPD